MTGGERMKVDELIEKVVSGEVDEEKMREYLAKYNLNELYEFWGKMARDHNDVLNKVSPITRTSIALPRDLLMMVRIKASSMRISMAEIVRRCFSSFLLDEKG